MITVARFTVNPMQVNSYLLYDETGECLVVDAGFYSREEEESLMEFIRKHTLTPVRMVNTHCHFDHIMGVELIRKRFRIPFSCHPDERFWIRNGPVQSSLFGIKMKDISEPDGYLYENEPVVFGNSALNVLHVPGHSPGHVVFHSPGDSLLISGDVLFRGSIGRSDFPGGNAESLLRNIHAKLMVLPPETVVWCGHGPETTIGTEKAANPFLVEV
jgi:glyoxylase-like metal-dependent hydrolase (beta-lactamase superfamily II)